MGQQKHKSELYAYLDQWSTEQLEELLNTGFCSDKDNSELLLHIAEVIEQREQESPTGRLADVDQAWIEFQAYYNTPEGEGKTLYSCAPGKVDKPSAANKPPVADKPAVVARPRRRFKQTLITVAATVGILFVLLLGAQAAGVNVFYSIVQWTEQSFHIVPDKNAEYHKTVQSAFEKIGVPGDLAPTWYPEGFTPNEPEFWSDRFKDAACIEFFNKAGDRFYIQTWYCHSLDTLHTLEFEWNHPNAKVITSHNREYCIYTNEESSSALWSDKQCSMLLISGAISKDDLQAIIDSIGGN